MEHVNNNAQEYTSNVQGLQSCKYGNNETYDSIIHNIYVV